MTKAEWIMLRRAQIVLWVSFMQEFSEILEKFCILRSCDWLKIETYLLPGRLEGTFLWHLCTLLRKQDRILAVRNQIQSNLVHPIKQKLIQKNYDTHQKKYMWYHFTSTSFHWTHSKKKEIGLNCHSRWISDGCIFKPPKLQ